jgi:hypothetical protein
MAEELVDVFMQQANPAAIASLGYDGVSDIIFDFASRIPGANIVKGHIFNSARFNALPANAKEIFGRYVSNAINEHAPGALNNALHVGLDYIKDVYRVPYAFARSHPVVSTLISAIGAEVLANPSHREFLLKYVLKSLEVLSELPDAVHRDEQTKLAALIDAYNGIFYGVKPQHPVYIRRPKQNAPKFIEKPRRDELDEDIVRRYHELKRSKDNTGKELYIPNELIRQYEIIEERELEWQRQKHLWDEAHGFETVLAPEVVEDIAKSEEITPESKIEAVQDIQKLETEQVGGAKKSDWQIFVAKYAKEHGITYFKAFKPASKEFAKLKKGGSSLRDDETLERQIKIGMQVEKEHKDVTHGNKATTLKIVMAHLKEDPLYYDKLAKLHL